MRRTTLQVIFAEDWLAKVWIGGSVAGAITALTAHSLPTFSVLGFSIYSVMLACLILLGGLIAYLGSLIVGSCVLPPIYRMRERLNGAPFQTGDVVEVLKKSHRGRVAQVLSGGDPQYGAFVRITDSEGAGEPLNLPWHSIRKLGQAEQGRRGSPAKPSAAP